MTLGSIRPHNLLKIDTAAISFADTRSDQNIPLSVLRELDEIQLVVVRRGGSLGFELASGKSTTTSGSDLDIIIYADEQFSRTVAQQLIAATNNLEVPVDIRIETPMCGFSLAEYAGSDAQKILLRTSAGPVLAHEPWDAKL